MVASGYQARSAVHDIDDDGRLSSTRVAALSGESGAEDSRKISPGHRRNLSSDSNVSQASTVLSGVPVVPVPLTAEEREWWERVSMGGGGNVSTGVPCSEEALLTADQRAWWEQRWHRSQSDLATTCHETFANKAEERAGAIRLRKMWRVCVYCDTLFTSNSSRFGETGAAATAMFADEYPRACVAPGACDKCLGHDETSPAATSPVESVDVEMGDATMRCSEDFESANSNNSHDDTHSTDGLEMFSSPSADLGMQLPFLPTEGVEEDRAGCEPEKKSRRKRRSTLQQKGGGKPETQFEPVVTCSNRFTRLVVVCSQ